MWKKCSICKNNTRPEDFAKRSQFYFRSWCVTCESKRRAQIKEAKVKAQQANSDQANAVGLHELLTKLPNLVQKEPKKRKEWSLSDEEYAALVAKPCTYCGFDLPISGVRLDRLDNSKGYITGNVVPCCFLCNIARNRNFTPDEMRLYLGPAIRQARLARQNPPSGDVTKVKLD